MNTTKACPTQSAVDSIIEIFSALTIAGEGVTDL